MFEKKLKALKKITENATKFVGFVKKAEQDLLKKMAEDSKNSPHIVLDPKDHFSDNYYTKSFNKTKNTATKAYLADMIKAESAEDAANATLLAEINEAASGYSKTKEQLERAMKSKTPSTDSLKASLKAYLNFLKATIDSREYFKVLSSRVATQYRNTLDAARSKVRLLKFWRNRDLAFKAATKAAGIEKLFTKQQNNVAKFTEKHALLVKQRKRDLEAIVKSRMLNNTNLIETEVVLEEQELTTFLGFENVLNDIRAQKSIPVRVNTYRDITNQQKDTAAVLSSYTSLRESIEKITRKVLPKGSEEEIKVVTDNAYRKKLAKMNDSNNPGLILTPEIVASCAADNSDSVIADKKRNVTLNYSNDEQVIPSEKLSTHSVSSYRLFKQSKAQFEAKSSAERMAAERRFSEVLGLKLRLKSEDATAGAPIVPIVPVPPVPPVVPVVQHQSMFGGAAGVGYASPYGAYESKGK